VFLELGNGHPLVIQEATLEGQVKSSKAAPKVDLDKLPKRGQGVRLDGETYLVGSVTPDKGRGFAQLIPQDPSAPLRSVSKYTLARCEVVGEGFGEMPAQ